jgi:hypothetical protein
MAEGNDRSERVVPPTLDVKPAPSPGGARVDIDDSVVTLDGTIVADRGAPRLARQLHDAFVALPVGPLEIHADNNVPWSVIAQVTHAAAGTGHTHVAFEVIARQRTAQEPPPSSIDHALDEWDRQFDALPIDQRLGNPPKSDFWQRVLRDCPGALDVVLTAGSGDDSPANVIAAKLPAATAACGCRVEVPALERLLWRLYGAEWAVPHAWIAVELGAGRAMIEHAATPWRDAAPRLYAAAAPGPITLAAN